MSLRATQTPHMMCPLHHVIWQPYPKQASQLLRGLQRSVFQGETYQSGQSRVEEIEQGTKRHKGWPASDAFRAPPKGPGILKLHI
jgi:hypothetical protein